MRSPMTTNGLPEPITTSRVAELTTVSATASVLARRTHDIGAAHSAPP